MLTKHVKSSNLESVGYDPDKRELLVKFKNGGVYRYSNVPAQHWAKLIDDDTSAGAYFHNHIRGAYDFERLDAPKKRTRPQSE